MRLATFYGGVSSRPALAIRKFIQKILSGEGVVIYGSGNQTRTYTHVEDVANGIFKLATKDKLSYTLYNITQNKPHSVTDIIKEILKHTDSGKTQISFANGRLNEDFDQQVVQSNRLRSEGWRPNVTWESGIARAVKEEQLLNK
jgi:nucleoside-diphosphate-sugar epimerase